MVESTSSFLIQIVILSNISIDVTVDTTFILIEQQDYHILVT